MNKTELLEAFTDYLDAQELDAQEDKQDSEQEDYDQQTDLYALFVEMSALKNEVKTQARQFKTAMDDFREVFHSLKEHQAWLEDELEKKEKQHQQISQKISRRFLLDLISLRDRILLSLNSLNDYQPGSIEKLFGTKQSFKQSVIEGQTITLKHIDRQLKQHRVRLIQTENQTMNPRLMKVVALGNQPELENGVILEEIRAGFILHLKGNKQLLRPAEVKVNKLEQ